MDWPLIGRKGTLQHALALISSGTGVAILGRAGVGKSRLLSELVVEAQHTGLSVVSVVATEATHSLPFAPFTELLDTGPTPDLLAMLASARSKLDALGGHHGRLIAIDDAQHLDGVSLAFVAQVIAAGKAVVALTARTSQPMDAQLVDLWTNGVITRLDVSGLGRGECRDLIEAALAGPPTDRLESELWRLSQGNPLVLHEILEGAVDRGVVRSADGLWDIQQTPITSTRLSDLIGSRLQAIPAAIRPGMEIVSVGAPLPYVIAEHALGDALGALEDRGMVTTVVSGNETAVVPAHPLYGEVLKTHLAESRIRTACRALVDAAIRSMSTVDPLRIAIWQRDSGEITSSEIALNGAQAALIRHDPALCEDLLASLEPVDDRVALLLGRALSYQQRFDEAEAVLADRRPHDPQLLTELASIRAQNLGFGLGRVSDARNLLSRAAREVGDADLRARLNNERGMVSAIHGDFGDTMSASDLVLNDLETSAPPRAAAYVALTVALAMTGDCTRFDEVHDDATRCAELARDVLPFAWDQIEVMHMASLINAGQLESAIALGSAAVARPERGEALVPTWLSGTAMAYILTGRLRTAARTATRARELFEQADPFGLQRQALGLMAIATAQMGDAGLKPELDGLSTTSGGARLTVWVDLGRAWITAAQGDVLMGAQIALEGAERGIAGEHYAWAMLCIHDSARLGAAELAVELARQIDVSKGAHLLHAMRDHVESLASEDSDGIVVAAERFTAMRADLLAAEAYAQAALNHQLDGDAHRAARFATLSQVAERQCEDPVTPALEKRPQLVTAREIDVALDAAHGHASREIADKRFISTRTVDNHLRSVYRKLDIGGREELAALLAGFTDRVDARALQIQSAH